MAKKRVKSEVQSEKKRIPYEFWAHSQLSVAKYYGGINIDGKGYRLDYDNAPVKIIDGEERYFPDLVEI
ncbi:MAG: hypothetical protein JO001_05900 [Alphaproteobacteria bacterium]|nr:hypothetical protein [Alphaproteobacteria bacterium]